MLRIYNLFRNELLHRSVSTTLHHRFENTSLLKKGFFCSHYISVLIKTAEMQTISHISLSSVWVQENISQIKKQSVFLENITNLFNTICKKTMCAYLLHFFFINIFIGESLRIFWNYFVQENLTTNNSKLKLILKIALLFPLII